MNWRPLLEAALDIIYPRIYCVNCGKLLQKSAVHGLCDVCCDSMPFIHEPICSKCGKPVDNYDEAFCPDCTLIKHSFDRGLSVFELTPSVQELIYRYKYEGEFSLDRTFGYFMMKLLQESGWNIDIIIPIPLHKNRLKTRGYNQAALLGDYISQRLSIPVSENTLLRRIDTRTQTRLNRSERAENLKDAFEVVHPENIKGKNVLLVDDIYTTGATMDNCSLLLRQAGAAAVYALTVATGRNN